MNLRQWTRRELLRQSSIAAGAGLLPARLWALPQNGMAMDSAMHGTMHGTMPSAPAPPAQKRRTLDARRLAAFVDPLPLPQRLVAEGRRSSAALGAHDVPYYRVSMKPVACKLHRDLPPSRLWSYGESAAPVLFEVKSGEGTLVEWVNELPRKHFLPLDSPMNDSPMNGSQSPGMENAPETRTVTHLHGARVPAISDGYPLDWFGPGRSRTCFYPNQQDAAALWVHDHAMGVSRLNIFAGLMGWYLIRDAVEAGLGLPAGKYELPLLLYDRSFDPQGQLYYPYPPDEGAWAEEFLGDAMLVNGKVKPFHAVEARRYRLRIANTANSRFFALSLSTGQSFQVIGSDQGLLAAPVERKRVVLAPAERVDLVVDFSGVRGENVNLMSDQIELMQFRVGRERVADESRVPATLRPVARIDERQAVRTRQMTLNEFDTETGQPMTMLLNRKHWADPVTEIVKLGSTEIWSLVNLTEETHPIHLHLVRFQILDRQTFSDYDFLSDDALQFTGDPMPPEPHERGWKDVVQCPAGTVTRIIVPFQGYAGRYLWHCHILEHEANDMMRPYDVVE